MDQSIGEAAVHDPAKGSHVDDGVVEHPTAEDFGHARALPEDRTWFKHAVFYEVLVRAFYDSNSDGAGDLRGLTEQLDYLKWLGVDCVWLPPFYDSPLRDPSSAPSTISSNSWTPRTAAAFASSPTSS